MIAIQCLLAQAYYSYDSLFLQSTYDLYNTHVGNLCELIHLIVEIFKFQTRSIQTV